MNILAFIYNEILYRPLFNALVFLTNLVPGHDIGIAIVLLTLAVRIILFPVNHRSLITQIKMKALEPEIEKIKAETKNKTEEQGKRMMELYKEHGVSPFLGCLTLLIQLPILIALYRVFFNGLSLSGTALYPFIIKPDFISTKLFGALDLSSRSLFLGLLASVSQFFQMKLAMPSLPAGGKSFKEEMSRAMAIQSLYVFPVLIFLISFRFPAALALYWTVNNLFATVHEGFVRVRARNLSNDAGRNNKTNNERTLR